MVKSDLYSGLKNSMSGSSNYLIISANIEIDVLAYKEMIKYMRRGNNIFIAADHVQGVLEGFAKFDEEAALELESADAAA